MRCESDSRRETLGYGRVAEGEAQRRIPHFNGDAVSDGYFNSHPGGEWSQPGNAELRAAALFLIPTLLFRSDPVRLFYIPRTAEKSVW